MSDGPLPPPPSYDDVVASGGSRVVESSLSPVQASAPLPTLPESNVFTSSSAVFPAGSRRISEQQGFAPPGGRLASGTSGQIHPRSSTPVRPPQAGTLQFAHTRTPRPATRPPQRDNLMDALAKFSMPTLMLTGYSIMGGNPELDTEAHIGTSRQRSIERARRRQRLRWCCSCLWCFGFLFLFLFIALPAAMILTALFGEGNCTYGSGLIQLLLYGGGAVLGVTVSLRLFASSLSCCKVSNAWNTEKSANCSICIGITEGLFAVLLVVNVIVFAIGAWLLLQDTPSEGSCSSTIYLASVSYLVGGLGLGMAILIYLVLAGLCYFSYQKEFTAYKYMKSSQRPPPAHRRNDTF